MKSSSTMQNNQQVIEITGNPAQVWGNVLVPAQGRITVKITGDTLQGTTKTGLEKKESWIRIQNLDSIEILESPLYELFSLGFFLIFIFSGLSLVSKSLLGLVFILVGAALIVFSIRYKRRYLAIYSYRTGIFVLMNKHSEAYQEFAVNVLMIARKLNSPVITPTRQAQTQAQ